MVNWFEVQAMGTVALVATSAGAISYAGLQLRTEREYRSVANLPAHYKYEIEIGGRMRR